MNTKQGILLVGIALLTVCAFTNIAFAKTWYVDDDDGPGIDFTSIQDAINNASVGDMILVYNGTYYENINLKDGVMVQGEGADVTIIDGGGADGVWASGVGSSTILDGFTITNCGVGVSIEGGAGPRISRNTFTGNGLPHAGAIWVGWSSPVITDNIITGNVFGAPITLDHADSTTIIHNVIANNDAMGSAGGGIAIYRSSSVNVLANLIEDNPTFLGGGIFVSDASATIVNNAIASNSASEKGGAMAVCDGATITLLDNTIINNTAPVGGGIYCDASSSTSIVNNIIWGNGDDLYGCTATYSDIEDGDPGEGNICAYPTFVDSAGGDYHLQAGSPCIDAGTNEGAPSTDFDGNPRPIDGDGDGIAIVDMGAFEYTPRAVSAVPAPTPLGLVALIGLLSIIAVSKIKRRDYG
jgi:parallel beta-helix repeat protein